MREKNPYLGKVAFSVSSTFFCPVPVELPGRSSPATSTRKYTRQGWLVYLHLERVSWVRAGRELGRKVQAEGSPIQGQLVDLLNFKTR